jgi:hypothetical protein
MVDIKSKSYQDGVIQHLKVKIDFQNEILDNIMNTINILNENPDTLIKCSEVWDLIYDELDWNGEFN